MNVKLEEHPLIVFDGAYGAQIQKMDLPAEVWDAYTGCTEYINLTAPEKVTGLHRAFLEAGALVIETNTFGANRIVLMEYGLQDRVREINLAAAKNAKRACQEFENRYVAGSMGPSTKLPSLGHIGIDEMYDVFFEQAGALIDGGVDLLILETCQDLLQVKTALRASFDVIEKAKSNARVMVSVTMESTGTMLLGSSIAAVVATLSPFPIFSLGLNCATGPDQMGAHVAYLARHFKGRISVMPNAGIPEVKAGKTVYPLTPEEFAAKVAEFVTTDGASIVGGCCGTIPAHIRALTAALEGVRPAERSFQLEPALASLYEITQIHQEIPPLIVGERMNVTGSRKFKKSLLADDFKSGVNIGKVQEQQGAHLLDLCVAYAGRDEKADMIEMITRLSGDVRAPLVIDSTSPEVIEAALKRYPGRALINSINLEDGGRNLERICRIAKRFGAAVVALAIGKKGMAMTCGQKIAVAKEIYDLAVGEYGLEPEDIFFDMLTFAIGSGDPSLKDAAIQTMEAVTEIKKALPGVYTILGVSNISFGLPKAARKSLTSVFLHEAIEAGLDAAIIDAAKIVPLKSVPDADREQCMNLIYNRQVDEATAPLDAFIAHFRDRKETPGDETGETKQKTTEQRLENKLMSGDDAELSDLLSILMARYSPIQIINELLVPTMRRIGELFGKGEMLLPFVLKSAEVMKKAVSLLEPFMEKIEGDSKTKIVLATVQGDVHDIGKNLVDIILSNNGFEVVNLGINMPVEKIVDAALTHKADAVGLSGLLVKSALVMKETLPLYAKAGVNIPILLGGAALTPQFVAESCVPAHLGSVVYCADAFEGLKTMQLVEKGEVESTVYLPIEKTTRVRKSMRSKEVVSLDAIPSPPFLGVKHVENIETGILLDYLNRQALIRGRWGYRRAQLSKEAYQAIIDEKVTPLLSAFEKRAVDNAIGDANAAYGWFRCHRDGDTLVLRTETTTHRLVFPRQSFPPHLCISDFFRSEAEGGDVAGLFVVTLGSLLAEEIKSLYDQDSYHDYLMLHGFSVELTDALAEHWHAVMRRELGITENEPQTPQEYATQHYRGSRYGFGYPACPDLDAHKVVFELLRPERIGVTLTENMEMVPELTTSAIVVHHPQAKYFSV
jgi:5-methyltetrahydrofolate--homocysteine methyltransferase